MIEHEAAVSARPEESPVDQRFRFGRNWKNFLETVGEERIQVAEQSLRAHLGVTTLPRPDVFGHRLRQQPVLAGRDSAWR